MTTVPLIFKINYLETVNNYLDNDSWYRKGKKEKRKKKKKRVLTN